MKKIKNIILLSILTICAVAVVGIDKVNAEVFHIGNSLTIICEPPSISAGQGTDCYLVGKPDPASQTASLNGYVTYAYTTDYLELGGAIVNQNIPNTGSVFVNASSGTQTLTVTNEMPEDLGNFVCNYDSENIESGLDFGCAIFYTTRGKANAFTPESIRKDNNKEILPNNNTLYGVIGSYQVSLSENVPENISACGELCVKAWNVPGESDYSHVKNCAADGIKADGSKCSDITAVQTSGDGLYFCQEVHYVNHSNPDTGTFASYALLVAGALIAISAIALAKKNNKLYRI